ncbi:hypothetical protein [Microbacterium sp.]|uniref:hypothetical protein n=1 Tax=Microbacterium sp. TaxID=51671 RepID=UPI0039E67B3F
MILRVRRLWDSITEPRHMKAAYFVLYTVLTGTGIATLLVPPTSIAGELGQPLSVAWSVFWILGGFGGMLTVFPGWWWAERLSIVLMWAGFAIYGLVVFSLHFTSSGSRLTQFGVIVFASGVGYIRWLQIRKYSFEPRGT